MAYIMVDIESDGPIPGNYSMIALGAVLVAEPLNTTFLAYLKPISENYIPNALAVSGFSREDTLQFEEPARVMHRFAEWVTANCKDRPVFISDNNGFDWMFVCWYLYQYTGSNPFGYSSQNLGSLYKGLVKDMFQNFKHLRKTAHTHNPLNDAMGNAEALIAFKKEYGLKIKL